MEVVTTRQVQNRTYAAKMQNYTEKNRTKQWQVLIEKHISSIYSLHNMSTPV